MSTVVSISSKSKSVAITDKDIDSLVAGIPDLKVEDSLLVWSGGDARVYFNIEPDELFSDEIRSEEEYELVGKIAAQLGFSIFVEGELVEEPKAEESPNKGCAAVLLCFFSLFGFLILNHFSEIIFA